MKTKLVACCLVLSLAPAVARAQVAPEWSAGWAGPAGVRPDACETSRANARRVKIAGMVLAAIGGTLSVTAIGLGAASTRPDQQGGEGQMVLGIAGMSTGGIGGALLVTGGLMWGLGSAREQKLTDPSFALAAAPLGDGRRINGGAVNLTIRF